MDHASITPVSTDIRPTERKAYVAPTLTDFGSFTEITQGLTGTAGVDNTVYS